MNLKLITKDLSINFFIKFISPLLGYIVLLLNIKYIETNLLGEIILAISYINIISSFSSLGFSQIAIKNKFNNLSINQSNVYKYLLFIQSFITFIIYLIINKFLKLNFIYLFFSILVVIGNYLSIKLRVNNFIKIYNFTKSLSIPIIQLILILFFIFNIPINYIQYLSILFASSLLIVFINYKIFLNSKGLANNFGVRDLKIFFTSSLFIGFSGFLSRLNTNVDNLMIANICGSNCLPEYKLHSILLLASQLFSMTYALFLSNKLAEYNSSQKYETYKREITKGIKLNLIYRSSDVLVCPSLYCFGPHIVTEALLNDLPVVAFDLGVAQDTVFQGKNGFLIKDFNIEKYADAIFNTLFKIKNEKDNILINEMKKTCSSDYEVSKIIQIAQEDLIKSKSFV